MNDKRRVISEVEVKAMDRISVRVCSGTTCYVLGGSELMDLARTLPPGWRDRVQVEGAPCLDLCRSPGQARPPFVKVGDRVVAEASVEKVVAALRELLA